MNDNNNLLHSRGLSIFLAIAALAFSASAPAVQVDKTIVNDGTIFGVGKVTAVQGPNGDVHVVAQGSTVASSFSSSNRHVYYWRIGGGGAIEVNALQVSTTLGELSRPDVKVNDSNEAIVVWKGASQVVKYAIVGTGGTVTKAEADALADINRGIAKVVLADNGTAHVLKTSSTGTVHRAFTPATNADVIAEHNIATLYCRTYTHPAIAIDSDDNLHGICSDNDDVGQLVYWMIEGATGDVLIDKTILNDDKASHLSLIARGRTLEVVYGDKRNTLDAGTWCDYCSLGGTAFYTRLRPYEDDMDGDAALPVDIVVGEEKQVANAWYGQSFLASDGKIHFLSGTAGDDSSHRYTDRDILHVEFSPGGTPSKEGTISAFMDAQTQYKQYATGAGKFAFWPEVIQNGVLAPGYTYQLMMANVSDLPTGSSGGGDSGSVGWLALAVLALGALARRARAILAVLAALGFSTSALAVVVDKTVINDGTVFGIGKVTAVQGPNGDVHVVAQGSSVASSFSNSSRHIYYWRIGGGGDIEVNALQVSATLGELSRPDIKVNGANEAIIIWKGPAQTILYAIVGTAGTVTKVEAVAITNTTQANPKLVLAANGTAHITKVHDSGMVHRAFTPSSNADVIAEHTLASLSCRPYSGHHATVIDSNGNLHTICSDTNNNGEAVYFMVDGATGAVLIDKTIINAPDDKAAHFSMHVTSGNILHVFYGDKRNTIDSGSYCDFCDVGGTAIYTRLKPYDDDRDGDAAIIDDIRVGEEQEITNAWYGQVFRGSDGKFHYLSGTAGDNSSHEYGDRNIMHVEFSPGGTPGKEGVIDAFMNAQTQYKQYATGAGKFAFWPEVVLNGVLATGYTYQLKMARVSDLPTGSGGGGDSGGMGLGLLAVLAMGLAFRRGRAAR